MLIKRVGAIDISKYSKDDSSETFYGLPQEVVFCKRCGYSNQKPNSAVEFKHKKTSLKNTVCFDDNGICDACNMAENKKIVDWKDREEQLVALLDKHRTRSGYNCLIPGSGGKDSFYAAHILKTKYGMNPLCVTFPPHLYTDWGLSNFHSWVNAGFNNLTLHPDGMLHRFLTRLSLENLFHPFQPFMFGQMYYPPKIASMLGIELVFYGENPVEYGNKQSDDLSKKDISYFCVDSIEDICLGGERVLDIAEALKVPVDRFDSFLPLITKGEKHNVPDVRYLGYYLKWHPQECYYYSVENSDFKAAPERSCGTYSRYSSIDDKIDDLHYYTTFIKFGIGRATYDASQEVRNGDITREEMLGLIQKYDGEYPSRFMAEICEYLDMSEADENIKSLFEDPGFSEEYFRTLTDSKRSPHLWVRNAESWMLRKTAYA